MIHLLFFEVDEILIVVEDPNICESSPGILYFFCCNRLAGLLKSLLFTLLECPPSPLDLDCSNVVHRESVILEQSASERHLVCRLDKTCTKVTHALILAAGIIIKRRIPKLLSQRLTRRENLHFLPASCNHLLLNFRRDQQVVRHLTTLTLRKVYALPVFFVQKLPHCPLDLDCCQVLRRHRS